jgi:RimJ/RimL family protein N-acetyltransferase
MKPDRATGYLRGVIAYPDPPLGTGVVALRRWEVTDLPLVRNASADTELIAGTTLPDPFTPEEGLAFIERQWSRAETGDGLSLAIEDPKSRDGVGCATLMLRRNGIADLGYWLVREARGRGIGGAAVALLVPWALRTMAIEAVEAFVHPENEVSRCVLTKCHFIEAGSRRHAVGRIDEELLVYRRAE